MIRGTTPTLIFNVDVDLRNAPKVSLTFRQKGRNVLVYDESALTIEADKVTLVLGEEDSAKLYMKSPLQLQLKALTSDGRVISHDPPVETTVAELFDMRRFTENGGV